MFNGRHRTCLYLVALTRLDIRHTSTLPDGTMHSLVRSAITKAKELGIEHLSLAATPACPYPSSRFFRWATRRAVRKAGGAGLRQFKSTFAPVGNRATPLRKPHGHWQ